MSLPISIKSKSTKYKCQKALTFHVQRSQTGLPKVTDAACTTEYPCILQSIAPPAACNAPLSRADVTAIQLSQHLLFIPALFLETINMCSYPGTSVSLTPNARDTGTVRWAKWSLVAAIRERMVCNRFQTAQFDTTSLSLGS